MTSSAIFLALQAGSLTLHTFSSSRRSCLITCSSFSLLRNAAPHLLPLNEAISNRVGDLIKPRGGSYSFQSTPCWSTGRPLIIDAKAGSVRLDRRAQPHAAGLRTDDESPARRPARGGLGRVRSLACLAAITATGRDSSFERLPVVRGL